MNLANEAKSALKLLPVQPCCMKKVCLFSSAQPPQLSPLGSPQYLHPAIRLQLPAVLLTPPPSPVRCFKAKDEWLHLFYSRRTGGWSGFRWLAHRSALPRTHQTEQQARYGNVLSSPFLLHICWEMENTTKYWTFLARLHVAHRNTLLQINSRNGLQSAFQTFQALHQNNISTSNQSRRLL